MKQFKIYTCGKMSGTTLEHQMKWRKLLEECVRIRYDGSDRIKFVHPPMFFNYEFKSHKTDKEILEWEMKQLHDCDILVVDFDGINDTVGSHMELGAVQGINRFGDRYIYVIGVGDSSNLHPWIKESCMRIEDNHYKAAKYIVEYLLI